MRVNSLWNNRQHINGLKLSLMSMHLMYGYHKCDMRFITTLKQWKVGVSCDKKRLHKILSKNSILPPYLKLLRRLIPWYSRQAIFRHRRKQAEYGNLRNWNPRIHTYNVRPIWARKTTYVSTFKTVDTKMISKINNLEWWSCSFSIFNMLLAM